MPHPQHRPRDAAHPRESGVGEAGPPRIAEAVRSPPAILFVTRMPPNDSGSGGAQRAMHLLRAVRRFGEVDLLVLHRETDLDAAADTLEAARPLVRSAARLEVAEWAPSWRRWPRLPWRLGQVAEVLSIHSVDAPRFGSATIRRIGATLSRSDYDLVFTVGLSSAVIVDQLIAAGELKTRRKIIDHIDMVSRFKRRELAVDGRREGRLRRTLRRVDIGRLLRAEREVTRRWDAASVSNADEAAALARLSRRRVEAIPNVVDRPLLPPRARPRAAPRLLFVGHLGYSPNAQGLTRFLREAWPIIRTRLPGATLDVVGLFPTPELAAEIAGAGARLSANVASVEPFFASCDLLVVPIFVGSGTRIKILEAMAFGRPVVSTPAGADGLGAERERHLLLAETAEQFAEAVARLNEDEELRRRITTEARALQQARYGPSAVDAAIAGMIGDGGLAEDACRAVPS